LRSCCGRRVNCGRWLGGTRWHVVGTWFGGTQTTDYVSVDMIVRVRRVARLSKSAPSSDQPPPTPFSHLAHLHSVHFIHTSPRLVCPRLAHIPSTSSGKSLDKSDTPPFPILIRPFPSPRHGKRKRWSAPSREPSRESRRWKVPCCCVLMALRSTMMRRLVRAS
jgi:hypothetical protein